MKRQKLISAWIAILFVIAPQMVFPQFTLSGKISDKTSNKPLPGANIVVQNSRFSTISASDGTYVISGLKQGEYQLRISYIGYKTLSQKVEIINNANLDFVLEYSPVISDEVIVQSTRVHEKTPSTFTSLENKDIERQNTGQDLPFILQITPSVVTTSDAGAGVGYTGIRIRGTDITRINVTMNGVPVNDAESQDVFFVDLPDLASSVDNIQIQRGVGTSTNGAAAFGASINIQTTKLNSDPYAGINSGIGSYNTFKNTLQFGSGLINSKWAFDGRLSAIESDGYIDRGWSDLKSFYVSGGYFSEKTILKAIVTSGREQTYQSWNGVPSVRINNDTAGMMRYEEHNLYAHEETLHMLQSDNRTFNLYTYANQTDNYQQDYYQLHFAHQFGMALNLTSALFYTKGKGYYESFNYGEDFADYGLNDVIIGSDTITSTNLINQKWLDNDFYGLNVALNYSRNKINATLGGGWNSYKGDHYGYIIWVEHGSYSFIDKPWYESTGKKTDYNVYAKANYQLTKLLNLYADVQLRNIDYSIEGTHDDLRDLTQEHTFTFFNPKGGVFFTLDKSNSLYVSVAIAHREPNRSAYRDADPGQQISAEQLIDFESGYIFQSKNISLEANYYYMKYRDQLVLTGKINNVGDPILMNVPKSYRTGIELSGGIQILKQLRWDMNLTLSQNKIIDFVAYTDNWDTWPEQNIDTLGTTDISFSPEIIGGSNLTWEPLKALKVSLQSKYVGSQFIDNTSNVDRSLDPYFINDLKFYYTIKTGVIRQIDLMLSLNNIFNLEYESNAWVYRYYTGNQENKMDGYFPQAKFNFMAGVSLKF
jgi:iron complex outermembrane receptor protein